MGWAARTHWRAPAAIVASALLLQGCELAVIGAAGTAAYSIAEDRRPSGTQFDDRTIAPRAESRVYDRFRSKVHVTATSFNRAVLLTGEVPDEATRQEITRIVLGVPGVRSVTNEMQVSVPTASGARLNDEYITVKVKGRIMGSSKVSPMHARAVVEDGVVYLLGLVTQDEADEAVDLARTTDGVRKVVTIFEYCRPTEEPCRPAPAPKEPWNSRARLPGSGS
jgi:osmotically-inducible protein OsmY